MVFCSGKQLRMQLYRRTPCDFLRLAVMVSHSQVPSAALELRMRNNEARCFTYRLAISDVRGSGPDPCIGFHPTVTDVTNPLTNQHQARSIVPGKGEKEKGDCLASTLSNRDATRPAACHSVNECKRAPPIPDHQCDGSQPTLIHSGPVASQRVWNRSPNPEPIWGPCGRPKN